MQAKEEEAIGFDSEAAVAYVLGRQYAQAAAIAEAVMRKHVRHRMLSVLRYTLSPINLSLYTDVCQFISVSRIHLPSYFTSPLQRSYPHAVTLKSSL
jgi:hypothetical protein